MPQKVGHPPYRSPLYWAAFASGLVWTLVLWARAAPLATALDDEVGHFLVARDAWAHPELILNVWGRSGTTIAFMLPAAAGIGAARAAAVAMSIATAIVATEVARLLGARLSVLIPVLLWFQPWFGLYGNAVLTEIPFSLTMIVACWAALTERTALASVLFGVLPLMRHEGIAVLGLWALVLLARREPRLMLLAAAPLALENALFSLVLSEPAFSVYLRPTPTAYYGRGGWLHYALPLARSLGPAVTLLAGAGLLLGMRDRRLLALAAPYGLYTLVQVVIFRFGLFASGGDPGFLLPVAPFAAVAAALGVDRLVALAHRSLPRVPSRRGVAVLLFVVVLATVPYALRSRPRQADGAAAPMRQAVRFLEARRTDLAAVTATHVWFFALSGARIPATGDGLHSPWSRPPQPRRLAPGAVVVWDCYYSERFRLRWRSLSRAGFRELARFGGGRVVVLQRAGGGGMPSRRPRCPSRTDRAGRQ